MDQTLSLEELKRLQHIPGSHRAILIAGPTAVGKSKIAIEVAKQVGGEIISCDSVQVYKGMDIGTAKVTFEERANVPHHLIDICSIDQLFNVVDFYRAATEAFRSIVMRGAVPILVGGTGFYFRTFVCGPPQTPPSDREVRENIEAECDRFGPEFLFEKLLALDPEYANAISAKDQQKIKRALEIITITQLPVSTIPMQSMEDRPQNIDFRGWFLHYPREILYERINQRCKQMLDMGLIEEVQSLLNQGLESNPSACKSIGYRQCIEFLNSARTPDDFASLLFQLQKQTRHYAKRQCTWFRKEPLCRWLDLSAFSQQQVIDYIVQDYTETT